MEVLLEVLFGPYGKLGKYSFNCIPLVNRLAMLEFEQWKHWASEILKQEDISDDRAERWRKLFETSWDDLSEENKLNDFNWAYKVLCVLEDDPIPGLMLIGQYIFNHLGLAYSDDPKSRFVSDFIGLIEDSKSRIDKVRS